MSDSRKSQHSHQQKHAHTQRNKPAPRPSAEEGSGKKWADEAREQAAKKRQESTKQGRGR